MKPRHVTILAALALLVLAAGIIAVFISGVHKPKFGKADSAPSPRTDYLIVVGVAGLRWSDVTAHDMPTLTRLLRHGSVGTLSVRSAPSVTCPAEGWLTLGSGNYAAISSPSDVDPDKGCKPRAVPPVASVGPQVPTMPRLREINAGLRFDAEPGTLGERLPCTTAVGPGAALATADPEGYLDEYAPQLPANSEKLLARCPFSAIDAGELAQSGGKRKSQIHQLDKLIAQVDDNRPPRAVLAVVGLAETEATQPRLHVCVLQGPGFEHGYLHSPSTRRVPFVQLADLAPTALELLQQDVPERLAGRPLDGAGTGRPAGTAATIKQLSDTDTQAVMQRSIVGVFFVGFAAVLVLVIGALWWFLRRRPPDSAHSRSTIRWLSIAALGLSAVPAATFVANIAPWWRASSPILAMSGLIVGAAAIMLALAIVLSAWSPQWSQRIRIRISIIALLTVLIFIADGLSGAYLQLNSLLGYNPLVAGRFIGFGNIAFAVYAVAAVLLANFISYGYSRGVTIALLAAVAIPVTIFDGLPQLGSDFGGVLTLVPTFVVLGLLLTNTKVTWSRVALATGGGLFLVLAIGWLDYLRPSHSRSHFGRFIASIVDGSALHTIRRKLLTSIDLLFAGPHTIAAFILVVIGIVLIFRPPPALRATYQRWPQVRIALVASVVLASFGFATNDSGIAIPTVMALVLLPTTVALCVWHAVGDPWQDTIVTETDKITTDNF